MTHPVLDWLPSTHAEQNDRYRMASLDCYSGGAVRSSIRRTLTERLDQGSEGACTGFGLAHVLGASPRSQSPVGEATALELYRQAQREDEWPGEAYDGSSVNGAMHAGRTLGKVREWRWARSNPEVQHALSYHAAVEAGSVWLDQMWEPDPDGYLQVGGEVVGGHAYAITGYRPSLERPNAVDYWLQNSWGSDWGVDGGAWLRDVDAHKLWFWWDGEVACPTKVS